MHFGEAFAQFLKFDWLREIASSTSGDLVSKGIRSAWGKFRATELPGRDMDAEAEYVRVLAIPELTEGHRRALDTFFRAFRMAGNSYRYNEAMASIQKTVNYAGATSDEKKAARAAMVVTLRDIAVAPTFDAKLTIAVSRGLMKATEAEYRAVEIHNAIEQNVLPGLEDAAQNARNRADALRAARANR